ncbi:hypothetical protein [Streptomyces sp. NPDC101237]|uniref:hypothetical protein n=1 Tax=Streptomyces sp. NPDC101237 TaxID=3366139 RepID=UPI00381AFBD1
MGEDTHGIGRRALFVTGAAAALTWETVSFAAADGQAPGTRETRTVRGTLPPGCPDFVYVPVEVPSGVREIKVSSTYDRPGVPAGTTGNALDLGVFDQHGIELGGAGFRGWSGGARTEFFVRADDATPGYLPGPVRAGTWHVALGPYTVAPQGLDYELTITLTYGEPGTPVRPVHPPERAAGRGPGAGAGIGERRAASGERRAASGERLRVAADTPVTVRLEASGVPRCTVRFVTDEGVLLTGDPLPVTGSGVVEWRTTPQYAAYVRAELRHETAAGPLPGALAALTNPIFLGR